VPIFLSGFLTWKRANDIEAVLKEVKDRLSSQILKEDTNIVLSNAKVEELMKKAANIISSSIIKEDTDV
jgi:hypothetical protein